MRCLILATGLRMMRALIVLMQLLPELLRTLHLLRREISGVRRMLMR